MKIIYVTNSTQQDDTFKKYIERLGLDIFVLTKDQDELRDEKTTETLSQIFSVILFDETIPDIFFNKVLQIIQPHFQTIIRITANPNLEKNRHKLKERGVHFYFDSNTEIDEFREAIFLSDEKDTSRKKIRSNSTLSEEFYNTKIFNFTNKEKYIYKYLLENHYHVVKREKMCIELFDDVSLSQLAALSSCINSIRKKMVSQGFESTVIKTIWGKGYKIDSNSYKTYK